MHTKAPYVVSRYARVAAHKSPIHLLMVLSLIFLAVRGFYVLTVLSQKERDLIHTSPHLWKPWRIFAFFGSEGLDMHDWQWRAFYENTPLLLLVMGVIVGISRYIRSQCKVNNRAHVPSERIADGVEPSTYMKGSGATPLALFHAIAGLIFVCCLHGPRVIFMFAFVFTNYFVIAPACKHLSPRTWMAVLWGFHVTLLFVNESYDGYRFESLLGSSFAWLDKLPQLTRWNVVFNMSTLRMIAYCIDYEEALHRGSGEMKARLEDKHKTGCTDCVGRRSACYKLRTDTPRPLPEYTLVHYLAYLFYVPLYVAGPMSSFNAFVSHIYTPQRWFGLKDGVRYFCRIAGYVFMLFGMLHFEHLLIMRQIPNISEIASTHGMDMRPAMFLQTLAFLWLKFSIIWKAFRLISLADGFDVPEDMQRCFAAATTVANFWRDWHSSFNIWIIRYMYIPLGGNKLKALAIVPIFGFIAIWHDIQLQLLSWAFLICLVFVPETIIISYFSSRRFEWLRDKPYYCLLRNFGSAITISALILSNMVGYGTGQASTEDAKGMVADISFDAVSLLAVILFGACHVNWRVRDVAHEAERRRRWELGLPIDASENIKCEAQLSLVP